MNNISRDVEIDKLKQKLTTLREAGEKMAERLRDLQKTSYFTKEDAAALEAWEAANK